MIWGRVKHDYISGLHVSFQAVSKVLNVKGTGFIPRTVSYSCTADGYNKLVPDDVIYLIGLFDLDRNVYVF